MKLTRAQIDMLETLKDHGGMSEQTFRLTFEKAEEQWARKAGFVERSRKQYHLTESGEAAFAAARR